MSSIKELMEQNPRLRDVDTNSDYVKYSAPKPYWNFWKVVLAGWLIKYPGKIFSGIFWTLLVLAMGVAYMITPSDTQNVIESGEYRLPSEELRDTYKNTYEKNVFNLFTK